MRVRVFDSDGVFRGGLLPVSTYDALRFRRWHAPPHPHFDEFLLDIAGIDEPCYDSSWFRVYMSKHPDIEGVGSDKFDSNSFANRFSLGEARDWLMRYGYAIPADLRELCSTTVTAHGSLAAESPLDPWAPYLPARWFKDQFGIPQERLRAAHRAGHLRAEKQSKRYLYSVRDAARLWPEDHIVLPPQQNAAANPG
ncbi:MAG TPA: hypothetical protein VK157_05450 [Phycisphaerales bacterium]|nr:hypothetical protein [Phycisphaerales bacterium]